MISTFPVLFERRMAWKYTGKMAYDKRSSPVDKCNEAEFFRE